MKDKIEKMKGAWMKTSTIERIERIHEWKNEGKESLKQWKKKKNEKKKE